MRLKSELSIVESKDIVELKCVEKLNNTHKKQLLTYFCLTAMHLGYQLNFSETLMNTSPHFSPDGRALT